MNNSLLYKDLENQDAKDFIEKIPINIKNKCRLRKIEKGKLLVLKGNNIENIYHAQVGIDTDTGISPGCRIPVGEEPELFEHIIQSAPYHEKDKLYEVRTVVAPNLNNEHTIKEVSKIIDNKCKYKLNAYRKYGVRKEGLKLHGEVGPSEEEMKIYLEYTKQNNL